MQIIAELVPRERHGLHTVESPQDKIRAEIDVNLLLRRTLEPLEEVAEYLPHDLAHCASDEDEDVAARALTLDVVQPDTCTKFRYDIYHTAALQVKCGEDVLCVPAYMAFTAEQLVQRSKVNTIRLLALFSNRSNPRTQEWA